MSQESPPLGGTGSSASAEQQLYRAVGQRLAALRRKAGLSQQQVSERIGIEPESVSRIENGGVAPSLARLRQFAELYGCSLEAVIGEASDLPADVASRIARELADLPESDRSFVAEQTINLIGHIKASRRRN